mmetsp:Transcript_17878/g.55817  ORF Transcript_17878/g.55817 Transcript_17878/m.55817 type:complete len:242 (+) Transcript_17878:188-913(+)
MVAAIRCCRISAEGTRERGSAPSAPGVVSRREGGDGTRGEPGATTGATPPKRAPKAGAAGSSRAGGEAAGGARLFARFAGPSLSSPPLPCRRTEAVLASVGGAEVEGGAASGEERVGPRWSSLRERYAAAKARSPSAIRSHREKLFERLSVGSTASRSSRPATASASPEARRNGAKCGVAAARVALTRAPTSAALALSACSSEPPPSRMQSTLGSSRPLTCWQMRVAICVGTSDAAWPVPL